ncbi:MAG: hypothetical protein JO270_12075 [Acidobacteriaceae bacterium]|nr:hypothetical protein [Acidobacteriaceae bacterium]MBV8571124.1 hypothetical protein [Acidobacteriaceae bacterium]
MMNALKLSLAGLLFCGFFLEADVNAPQPGFVRYEDGHIGSVLGVPGNLVVRGANLAPAEAASFSDLGALLLQNGRIVLQRKDGTFAGAYDSAGADPLLSITGDFSTALAWLPSQGTLLHWTGSNFVSIELGNALPQGVVTSVTAVAPDEVHVLVMQSDRAVLRCAVSLTTGLIESCDVLPGVTGPAFEHRGYVVFEDSNGLQVQNGAGITYTFAPAASDLRFQSMSSGWLHLYSPKDGRHWALRLQPGNVSLSQLPATLGGGK